MAVNSWPPPWYSVAEDPAEAAAMEHELRRELSAGHPLFCLPIRTIGRRQRTDDVLFMIDDGTGRVAEVHLTWTQNESPPWPFTTIYPSAEAWMADRVREDRESFRERSDPPGPRRLRR